MELFFEALMLLLDFLTLSQDLLRVNVLRQLVGHLFNLLADLTVRVMHDFKFLEVLDVVHEHLIPLRYFVRYIICKGALDLVNLAADFLLVIFDVDLLTVSLVGVHRVNFFELCASKFDGSDIGLALEKLLHFQFGENLRRSTLIV